MLQLERQGSGSLRGWVRQRRDLWPKRFPAIPRPPRGGGVAEGFDLVESLFALALAFRIRLRPTGSTGISILADIVPDPMGRRDYVSQFRL